MTVASLATSSLYTTFYQFKLQINYDTEPGNRPLLHTTTPPHSDCDSSQPCIRLCTGCWEAVMVFEPEFIISFHSAFLVQVQFISLPGLIKYFTSTKMLFKRKQSKCLNLPNLCKSNNVQHIFCRPLQIPQARVSEAWLSYLYKDVFEQKSRVHLASLNLNIFTICNNGETYKTEQMHVQNILLL